MKIRIPLSNLREAKIVIQKSDGGTQNVTQIDVTEHEALISALSAQRETITGQPWSDISDDLPDEPDYVGLIDTIKETGGAVEINGVKIQRCDEYGRTAAELAAYLHLKHCTEGKN